MRELSLFWVNYLLKKKDDIAFVQYSYTDIVAQKYCMIPDGPD